MITKFSISNEEKKKLGEFSRMVVSWYGTDEYKTSLEHMYRVQIFFFLSNFGSIV